MKFCPKLIKQWINKNSEKLTELITKKYNDKVEEYKQRGIAVEVFRNPAHYIDTIHKEVYSTPNKLEIEIDVCRPKDSCVSGKVVDYGEEY